MTSSSNDGIQPQDQPKSKNKFKQFLPLIVIIALMVAAYFSGLGEYLSFESIKDSREVLQQKVAENPILVVAAFSLLYIAAVALSLPFATILTLLGGFLFGAVWGTIIVVTSATIGATLIFLIARSSFGAFLRQKAGGLYNKVEKDFSENSFNYLLFLRLAPIFPFAIVNILPALFNMDTKRYITATLIGILPGSAVYVYTGQSLGTIEKLSDLASPQLITAFALLSAMALVPTLLKKMRKKSA